MQNTQNKRIIANILCVKSSVDMYLKDPLMAGSVAQLVERLSSMCEVLGSICWHHINRTPWHKTEILALVR